MMSLNITSDGSPTPRKGAARFSIAEDLRLDTSPEVLGTVVGSRHPLASYRFANPFLTSDMQGVQRPNPVPRPFTSSNCGVQAPLPAMMAGKNTEAYKVCHPYFTPPPSLLGL